MEPEDEPPRELNPVPFVAAVVVVAVLVVLAYVFLRADDSGELVRPVRLTAVDDRTVRAEADLPTPCHRVRRAQVDMGEDTIFVELVVVDERGDDEVCAAMIQPVEAELTLPDPIDGRELRAGIGRFPLPCEPAGGDGVVRSYRCAPER